MKEYYVNDKAQSNGDHEVHHEDCTYLPSSGNRTSLGSFPGCKDAVKKAKEYHRQVNGCKTCSSECHTQ